MNTEGPPRGGLFISGGGVEFQNGGKKGRAISPGALSKVMLLV